MIRIFNITLLPFLALLCCLQLVALSGTAQTPGSPNDLDKNYVPDKNSIFNSAGGKYKNTSTYSPLVVNFHNIVVFNPVLLIQNIAALQFEHRLSNWIGVQGGLGLVFGPDRFNMANYSITGNFINGNSPTDLGPDKMITSNNFTGKSFYFSLAARFYFIRHYYDDLYKTRYLETGVRSYSNSFRLDAVAMSITGNSDVTLKNSVYYLAWGRYMETPGKRVVTVHHLFIGAGLMNTSYDVFMPSSVYNPASGYAITTYTKNGNRANQLYPTVLFGYEFGIAFK